MILYSHMLLSHFSPSCHGRLFSTNRLAKTWDVRRVVEEISGALLISAPSSGGILGAIS